MASFSGVTFLFLAGLVAIPLFTPFFTLKPPGGNDEGATGYLMILVAILHLGFLFFMALATMAIARNGGFDWISERAFVRNGVVWTGLITAVFTLFFCAVSKLTPDDFSAWVQGLLAFGYYFIPITLVTAGFVLLIPSLRAAVPALVYQVPLGILFVGGLAGAGTVGHALFAASRERSAQRRANIEAVKAESQQANLHFIDSCDLKNDFPSLLTFTHRDREPVLRERALARVKSSPDWQQQLVFWLENKGAIEVFTFLSDNDVDDPQRLAEPVKTGVLSIANFVRERIGYKTDASQAHPHEFMSEVTLALRAVQKFEGLGVDFRPAVKDLRAAFDAPCPAGRLRFDCVSDLDAWLNKHQ